MALEDRLKEKGWVEIRGKMISYNTKTGKKTVYDDVRRLISPDGRSVYRPGNDVYTSFSSEETITIE